MMTFPFEEEHHLTGITNPPGKTTYVGVRFDAHTTTQLHAYAMEHKIPNPTKANNLHTTLLYSYKHLPNYVPPGRLSEPLVAELGDFGVWQTNSEGGKNKQNCLVILITSPELVVRHMQLKRAHGVVHDYLIYQPHITLSYDIGDLDVESLPNINKFINEAVIVEEYGELFDSNRYSTKGR